jgi:hypothetical protein
MDYASLQDAFPIESGKPAKKKKTSRDGYTACEIPVGQDPDRPAYKRLFEVPPMKQPSTDGVENTLLDESTAFQQKPTVMNSLPKPRGPTALEGSSAGPAFFGAEPFTNPSEETTSPFSTADTPNQYMLNSDFTTAFSGSGADRASGGTLPTPELRFRWKPMSGGGVNSSFYESEKPSQFQGLSTDDMSYMKQKLDSLIARLDDLENRANGSNPQMEMLSFIMVGLFLMFGLDVAVRKGGAMRLVNVA